MRFLQKRVRLQKTVTTVAQLFVVISVLIFQLLTPSQAFAQDAIDQQLQTIGIPTTQTQQVAQTNTTIGGGGGTPKTAQERAIHPLKNCVPTLIGGIGLEIDTCVAGVFYFLFVDLTAPIVFIAGRFLDYTVALALDSSTYSSNMIQQGWTVARDLANMAFVFVLIYIALRSILNIEGVMSSKMLGKVLAVALVINFSFFFTRVVIDVTNILAFQFYKQVPQVSGTTIPGLNALGAETFGTSVGVRDLSQSIMAGVGVQQVLQDKRFTEYIRALSGGFGSFAIQAILYIAFGVLNIILAFVFFYSAFQFIGRIVALWLAIIASPLGFLGMAVPQLGSLTSKWWDGLLKNALYAPVFFFLMYLVLIVVDSGSLTLILNDAKVASANTTNSISGIYSFIVKLFIQVGILVGLLIAVLKAADSSGTFGANFAKSAAQKITGAYGNPYAGFISRLPQNTLGAASYAAAQSNWLRSAAANDKSGVSGLVLRGTTALSKAGLGAGLVSSALSSAGIKVDSKDGYVGNIKARAEALEKQAKLLKPSDEKKERNESAFKSKTSTRADGTSGTNESLNEQAKKDAENTKKRLEDLNKEIASNAGALSAAKAALEETRRDEEAYSTETTRQAVADADAKVKKFEEIERRSALEKLETERKQKEAVEFQETYKAGMEKAAGKKNVKAYAELIKNRGWYNPIRIATNGPGNREGVIKIMKSLKEKSTADQVKELLKKELDEEKKKEHKDDHKEEKSGGAHSPAPAIKTAPAAKADDHGHAGGDHH